MDLVKLTTKLSIIAQALSFFPAARGLTLTVQPEKQMLQDILKIELTVTLIQFMFYIFLYHSFDLATMATTRYYDWFLTTPAMLFSMASYFLYASKKPNFNKASFVKIFIANFFMLLFGYLAEIGFMDRNAAFVLGFVAFAVAFRILYKDFRSEESDGIFKILTTVWGLYGVAFMLPNVEKNIMYNGLDIIAKNFFAIFLSYKLKR